MENIYGLITFCEGRLKTGPSYRDSDGNAKTLRGKVEMKSSGSSSTSDRIILDIRGVLGQKSGNMLLGKEKEGTDRGIESKGSDEQKQQRINESETEMEKLKDGIK